MSFVEHYLSKHYSNIIWQLHLKQKQPFCGQYE